MKQTINVYDFRDAFNRMDRGEQFTYEGLEQLFNYLESYEDDTDEQIELDVIALCCEYSEMTAEEIETSYGYDMELEHPLTLDEAFSYLADKTSVIGRTDTTIIFQDF